MLEIAFYIFSKEEQGLCAHCSSGILCVLLPKAPGILLLVKKNWEMLTYPGSHCYGGAELGHSKALALHFAIMSGLAVFQKNEKETRCRERFNIM